MHIPCYNCTFVKKQQVRFAPYLSHMFSLSLQSGKLLADWLNGQELLRPYQGGVP